MLNTVYRLVAPRRFEVAFDDINLNNNDIIVRPTHLSICHADQRYYQGLRPAEILAKKLPMALIHEAIGKVVYDPLGEWKAGDRVVMIPNTPTKADNVVAENYLRSSKFRASGFDGFMQDVVAMGRDRIVAIKGEGLNENVLAFTELMSVSVEAISRFDRIAHKRRDRIGIWGDGNLGYITALFLHYMMPKSHITILGVTDEKLGMFSFADETMKVTDIPKDFTVDHAFECVGSAASGKAIDQIIDFIEPEGSISLLGVSEYPVPINTRMVLEKGLRLFGSSRSSNKDFEETVRLYETHREILDYLNNLVGNIVPIRNISDMNKAFENDIQKPGGKTILRWWE